MIRDSLKWEGIGSIEPRDLLRITSRYSLDVHPPSPALAVQSPDFLIIADGSRTDVKTDPTFYPSKEAIWENG